MSTTTLKQKMQDLVSTLISYTLSYNEENKEVFRHRGLKALNALAAELPFKTFEVRFNPGGIAVAGDLILHGMFEDGRGIYMNITQHGLAGKKVSCYCRAVTSMKDYVGKRNYWLSDDELLDVKELKNTLVSVSKEATRT